MTSSRPASRGARAARIVLRVVLVAALVVLIGANAVRHGPRIVAAFTPSTPSARAVAAPSTAATAPAPSASASASASASGSASAGTGGSGGGSGSGGSGSGGSGSGGSGGSTTSSAPKPTTQLAITQFDAEDVQCPRPSGGQFSSTAPSPDVIPEWNSTGAVKAWFGVDTSDAKANPYEEVDPNGAIQFTWPCPQASQTYALTIEDAAGHDVTKTYTAHNTGYTG